MNDSINWDAYGKGCVVLVLVLVEADPIVKFPVGHYPTVAVGLPAGYFPIVVGYFPIAVGCYPIVVAGPPTVVVHLAGWLPIDAVDCPIDFLVDPIVGFRYSTAGCPIATMIGLPADCRPD